jgi:integrase
MEFGDREIDEVSSNEILKFLNRITDGRKQQTKRTRYAHIASFFNFINSNISPELKNPCDSRIIKKLFRSTPNIHWDIIEKETVDEIIFRTIKTRNRIILELMARGGMRIGEVLKLTPNDMNHRKLMLKDPKSGKEQEIIFIPQKVADRLKEYIRSENICKDQRIFPIGYEAARAMVKKAGDLVGIHLRPHDLRRHAATYASRSGVPLEIISKVILRHAHLSTTQMYLGKISDSEAIRWIENIYA